MPRFPYTEIVTGLSRGAFRVQRNNAKQRGIPFRFTYEEWVAWWNVELLRAALTGQIVERTNRGDGLNMCRHGDQGAYESGNVFAGTTKQNLSEVQGVQDWRYKFKVGEPGWLDGKRGYEHPKSHAVDTPLGRFGSIALAAEAHGLTRAGGLHRLKRGLWKLA